MLFARSFRCLTRKPLPTIAAITSAAAILAVVMVLTQCVCVESLVAQDDTVTQDKVPKPLAPSIAQASGEAAEAISTFKVPEGWKVEVFAAEPDVANGVALFVDSDGSVLVCESFRQSKGIEDNRSHSEWLLDDLAAQTVEDRLAYIKKHLGDDVGKYMEQDDRIKVLKDTDGDGKADSSVVFAEGFNSIVAGTGAGVLRYNGDTFYTCIPDLWLLRDKDGDGKAEVRKSLQTGYGVRFAFRGHDMHGLIIGPDGRLYFSIGDRGYNVKTDTGHWVNPASGAVFRCELDGSDFQVIATGLRNPQELAFDEFGNLFTGDNNSDSGDKARWVYIANGGDSGWRMFYQYLGDRGPFNREKIWNPYDSMQTPAYIVPPITNVSDGPSGLAYYPGTGLGDRYDQCFFLCDFRGQSSNSGVRSFRNKPKGAFFELVDSEQPIWQVLATDLQFGPDGQIYLLDWVHGWEGLGKGRIYRLFDSKERQSAVVSEVKSLLAGKIAQSSVQELHDLTSHKDMRVRQEAQFELVRRGDFATLESLAKSGVSSAGPRYRQLARLHGVWGLMQLYRSYAEDGERSLISGATANLIIDTIGQLLDDSDVEVRKLAAQQTAEIPTNAFDEKLIQMLGDDHAPAAYFAAQSIGKHKVKAAASQIMKMLNDNADSDPILRHGAIMALAGINDDQVWTQATQHSSPSVRLATVVAMRRTMNPAVVNFLTDGEPRVVIEAARAIHDLPIASGMEALAQLLPRAGGDDALVRRALNANFRLGGAMHAQRLAAFAASGSSSVDRRKEALDLLATWDKPGPLDKVTNEYRPLEDRDGLVAVIALKDNLPGLLASEEAVNAKTIEVAASVGIQEVAPILREVIADTARTGKMRASALVSLYGLEGDSIEPLVRTASEDASPEVRAGAVVLLTQIDPELAGELLEKTIRQGEVIERQAALRSLGKLQEDAGRQALTVATELYVANQLPGECALDLILSLQTRQMTDLLAQVNHHREVGDGAPVAQRFAELLSGGDWDAGRKIFYEKTEVSCVRCHMIGSVGGAVGPLLSDVGIRKDRGYLLESIMEPNRQIAEGFQTEIVLDLDGVTHTGIVKSESDDLLELMNSDGGIIRLNKEDIDARKRGLSSMPADIKDKLTPTEVRDLMEFLANLKEKPKS